MDPSKAATTTMKTSVTSFDAGASTPDTPEMNLGEDEESYWDYPLAGTHHKYYKTIAQFKKSIDTLALWTVGLGAEVFSNIDKEILEHITGWGEDNIISIFWNMIVQKKVFGCAFAEIVTFEDKPLFEGGKLLNIKPLYTGHMRVVVNGKGIIIRYEHRVITNGKVSVFRTFEPHQIFHISNDRIANEIHGTSAFEACEWIITAKQEAMEDHRKILHRDLAMGVLEIDTDDPATITTFTNKYGDAVKNGEVLVLPKGTAELKDAPQRSHQDRLAWIEYLDNHMYTALGVPKAIADASNFTEAASKVGFMTFQPVYTMEQTLLEADVWNQLGIKIKFNRPPSLTGLMQESELKNTGQTGFQPNDVQLSATKNE